MQMAPPTDGGLEPEEYGQEGPVRWEAPEDWRPERRRNDMRYAQYAVGSGEATAEMVVFHFGEGGGGVEENLQRWSGQFSDGPEPVRDTREIAGMTVHLVDASGTYDADMAMIGGAGPIEDQRMIGAIAETASGRFFFRLLGDRQAVGAQEEAFEKFLGSLHHP